jgi:uncharacterized membrane protein YphA (DoxX/SURF4 family)
MNTWTRIGLVLLRVAIGWHFLFEGLEKIESWQRGPSEGNQVWSAEGYLRESQGPLAGWFRAQAGDLDRDALDKLARDRETSKLSPHLESDWREQFNRFAEHYGLGQEKAVQPEFVGVMAVAPGGGFPAGLPWSTLARSFTPAVNGQLQKTLALDDMELARERALRWLDSGSREVPTKLAGVTEKIKETTAQRIANYRKNLDKIAEMEDRGMPAFDQDVFKDQYRTLKREINVQRAELMKELNKPLTDVLSVATFRLSEKQRGHGPLTPAPPSNNVDMINAVTRWGVTAVGACLLLGLFTRLACLGGAAFLLLFYLAMPALPWLPVNPRSEGHYLFINKNIIEMLALLALATTQSGKWLGLDGIIAYFNPFHRGDRHGP